MVNQILPPPIHPKRVFYMASPGDAIRAHKHWLQNQHDPTEVSITFTSQVEQYCKDVGAKLYLISYHSRKEYLCEDGVTIEHLPKPWSNPTGIIYHLGELWYGLQLLVRAIAFQADVALLESGCTHYFCQTLFALAGIKVVPVLQNTLWAAGHKPKRLIPQLVNWLDKVFFWQRVPWAVLCLSPECERQAVEMAGQQHCPMVHYRPQFLPEYFSQIPPPPPHQQQPFQIVFIGRITRIKGVFDIIKIASSLESKMPGRIRWEICGRGPDFEEMKQLVVDNKLEHIVHLRGWTSLEELLDVYANSQASIVPTRSSFIEGLAMTAVEAILANRPVITNPVVPALEILQPAAVVAKTDDPDSYVEKILKLIDDPQWYEQMVQACPKLALEFYDRKQGLTAVLKHMLNGIDPAQA